MYAKLLPAATVLLTCMFANQLAAASMQQDETEATSSAEEAVNNTALDYAMSWYTGDPERMKNALHPKLAKRRPMPGAGNADESLSEMTAQQLVDAVATGHGKQTPQDQRRADVEVLDITAGMASVKLDMNGWTDYMHLAKLGDRWVIVNVLWQVHEAK